MFNKIVAVFMLLMLAARPSIAQDSEESFMSVTKGDIVPYTGYLFTPEALAKIYADIEQQEKSKELEFNLKLDSLRLDLSKLKEMHNIELINRDLLLEKITIEKNKTIEKLNFSLETQKWFTIGAFIAGVLVTGGTIYYISTVIK